MSKVRKGKLVVRSEPKIRFERKKANAGSVRTKSTFEVIGKRADGSSIKKEVITGVTTTNLCNWRHENGKAFIKYSTRRAYHPTEHSSNYLDKLAAWQARIIAGMVKK